MKKIVLAALGAALITGAVANSASAAQRNQPRPEQQQVRTYEPAFRNSYNAYDRNWDRPAFDTRIQGGAISAPAGR